MRVNRAIAKPSQSFGTTSRIPVRRRIVKKPPSPLQTLLPILACSILMMVWIAMILAFILLQDNIWVENALRTSFGFRARPLVECTYDKEDVPFFFDRLGRLNMTNESRPHSYILINEPRSGSSWLQEMSQMHPGIKVQFELDMKFGNDALQCKQCRRNLVPDSKHLFRIPPKVHPPHACGMTIFGSSNKVNEVRDLARSHNASLVLLLRLNHVAHAISSYLKFSRPRSTGLHRHSRQNPPLSTVPWTMDELRANVHKMITGNNKLLQFALVSQQPAHLIFYEDLKRHPEEVWQGFQRFLGIPYRAIDNASSLERMSTNKPSIHYLQRLPQLQSLSHEVQDWSAMLLDPAYDDHLDVALEFEKACKQLGTAALSWRGGRCVGGRVVALDGAGGSVLLAVDNGTSRG